MQSADKGNIIDKAFVCALMAVFKNAQLLGLADSSIHLVVHVLGLLPCHLSS